MEGLAAKTKNERFALDSYRRFISMFGHIVMGVHRERFDEVFAPAKNRNCGAKVDTDLDATALKDLVISHGKRSSRKKQGGASPKIPSNNFAWASMPSFRLGMALAR